MTLLQWLFLIVLALLVYSYVVYPLIAAIIGVGPVANVDEELPAVSILVPAHNEETVIAAKIENFQGLDYPSRPDRTGDCRRRQHGCDGRYRRPVFIGPRSVSGIESASGQGVRDEPVGGGGNAIRCCCSPTPMSFFRAVRCVGWWIDWPMTGSVR